MFSGKALSLFWPDSACHAGGRECESRRAGGAGLFAQRLSAIFLSEFKSPSVAPSVSLTNRIRQNRLTVITNCFANRIAEGLNRGLVRAAEPL